MSEDATLCWSLSLKCTQKFMLERERWIFFLESIEYNNRSTMPAGWCIWSSDVAVHMFLGIASPKMQKKFLCVNVEGTDGFDTSKRYVISVMFEFTKTVSMCARCGIFSGKHDKFRNSTFCTNKWMTIIPRATLNY